MKKQGKILMVGLLAALVLTGVLWAERRPGTDELQGTFVRLTEQRVGEQGYMGVVVKPLEKNEHVTVLVARQQEELVARARRLREGQRVGIAYMTEAGHKWAQELEADLRGEGRRPPEQVRAQPAIRELSARLERMQRELRELRQEVERLRAELREGRGQRIEIIKEIRGPRIEIEREIRRGTGDSEHDERREIRGPNIEIRREIRGRTDDDEHGERRESRGPKREIEREIRGRTGVDERREREKREEVQLRRNREVGREVGERGDREAGRERPDQVGLVPPGMRGFRGILVGRIIRRLDLGFVLKVEQVPKLWENNKADNPQAAIGKELTITIRPDEERGRHFLEILRELKTGDRVTVEAFHFEGNRLTVVEQLQKSD